MSAYCAALYVSHCATHNEVVDHLVSTDFGLFYTVYREKFLVIFSCRSIIIQNLTFGLSRILKYVFLKSNLETATWKILKFRLLTEDEVVSGNKMKKPSGKAIRIVKLQEGNTNNNLILSSLKEKRKNHTSHDKIFQITTINIAFY